MFKAITEQEIKKIDSQNMFDILKDFPEQVKEAIAIGKKSPIFPKPVSYIESTSINIHILGMGGSAIGGDILRTYCRSIEGAEHLNISVTRNYSAGNIIPNSYIIASSYSGETEETISALNEVLKISNNIVCITTGGKLEKIARDNNLPVIKIPAGLQPRCALGYSFFTMLYLLLSNKLFKIKAVEVTEKAIKELLKVLAQKAVIYSDFKNENNPPLVAGLKLSGTIPVIYSSVDRLEAVNWRWRGQIQENAKNFAFGSFLPEMNHNEINGWNNPADLTKAFSIIFLKDKEDNPRTKIRFDALSSIIADKAAQVFSFEGDGEYLLTRMFDLIYLGDWISYYLAIYSQIDPTPIPYISKLKNFLASKE